MLFLTGTILVPIRRCQTFLGVLWWLTSVLGELRSLGASRMNQISRVGLISSFFFVGTVPAPIRCRRTFLGVLWWLMFILGELRSLEASRTSINTNRLIVFSHDNKREFLGLESDEARLE